MSDDKIISLGDVVRDTLTDFEGIVTAKAEFLYSTPTMRVTPTSRLADGRIAYRWPANR